MQLYSTGISNKDAVTLLKMKPQNFSSKGFNLKWFLRINLFHYHFYVCIQINNSPILLTLLAHREWIKRDGETQ